MFPARIKSGTSGNPVTPGNNPGRAPGSPAASQWWAAQQTHQGQIAHHVGKRQAASPLITGNLPGLVPGSPAEAQLLALQLAHHHVQPSSHQPEAAGEWWAAQGKKVRRGRQTSSNNSNN